MSDHYPIPDDFDIDPFVIGSEAANEVVNAWAKQLLERDMEQMTARLQEPITAELLAAKAPLRPNVTPVVQPAIRLLPLLLAVVLSVPWWIGAWQIAYWIYSR